MEAPVLEYVQHVLKNIEQVDAFIVAELKRIKEESLPPWRECTLEEALEYPDVSKYQYITPYGTFEPWTPIARRQGSPVGTYRYRTRAPKQEPKRPAVKAPEGWYWGKNVRGEFQLSKPTRSDTFSVPWGREVRDAMLACVAAFDLGNGPGLHMNINASGVPVFSSDKPIFLRPGSKFLLVEVPE